MTRTCDTATVYSVEEHIDFIKAENNRINSTYVADLYGAVRELSPIIKSALKTPENGLYFNGICVIRFGKDKLYKTQRSMVPLSFESGDHYLQDPVPLYNLTAKTPIPITEMLYRLHIKKQAHSFANKQIRSAITSQLNETQLTTLYLKELIVLTMSKANPFSTAYISSATGETEVIHSTFLYPNKYVKDEHLNVEVFDQDGVKLADDLATYVTQTPVMVGVLRSLYNFMEKHPWSLYRVGTSDGMGISPTLMLQAFSDKRITYYHESQIEHITKIKQDIFDGIISDPGTIQTYSDL